MSLIVIPLVGRIGADPDVKFFESVSVKCRLTLAVNRPTSRTDQPDWFNLEPWGRDAEFAANYVRKGKLVGVKGALKLDTWVDQNTGANRSSPVIRVERLELLGAKRDSEESISDNAGNDEF